ncbi:hypothetical protein [Haloterrigena turkmenica]|uniref:hypothetical protein n=1 Tax=Haloterrigena turkmenica TaxID=62320 RepID=UPI000677D347|nr:hypothetical protein [Haloterrigena turkmenica]
MAVSTFALFATVFGRVAFSQVVPEVAAEFGLSTAVIGLALTGVCLTYALLLANRVIGLEY